MRHRDRNHFCGTLWTDAAGVGDNVSLTLCLCPRLSCVVLGHASDGCNSLEVFSTVVKQSSSLKWV